MPLVYRTGAAARATNIRREEAAGKDHAQSVAIALHTEDEAKKRHGKMTLAEVKARRKAAG